MKTILNIMMLLVLLTGSIQTTDYESTKGNRYEISLDTSTKDSWMPVNQERQESKISSEFSIREPELKLIEPLQINPRVSVVPRETCKKINAYDKSPLTGFVDDWGYCVPGLVTNEVWFTKSQRYVYGVAVPYSPGMMKATAVYRDMGEVYANDSKYLGGVATASPADIGETVWLRRAGHTWEGPYMVVDCSRRADMYTHIAINKQVVEIDFETAVRWGIGYYTEKWWGLSEYSVSPVEVYYGVAKPSETIREEQEPIFYADYWLENIVEYQREKIEPSPRNIEAGFNPVWDLRDGSGEHCYTTVCKLEQEYNLQ